MRLCLVLCIVALLVSCCFGVVALRRQPLLPHSLKNAQVTILRDGGALHPSYVSDSINGGDRVWNILLFASVFYYLMQATSQLCLRAQVLRSSATVVTWHPPMLR